MTRYVLVLVATMALVETGCVSSRSAIDPAKQKAYAMDLLNHGLYSDATAAFDRYIDLPGVSNSERAKTLYYVANALFDHAKDYHEALLHYVRLKAWYPDFPDHRDVDSKIVECLERTGHSLEAQLALEQAADLNRQDHSSVGGTVVVEVGKKKITKREVLRDLDQLPPDARRQFEGTAGMRKFLQQVAGQELLYDTAVRRGYRNSPDINRQVDQVRHDLMVQKVIDEDTKAQPTPTDSDLQDYYMAHPKQFAKPGEHTPQPFNDVRSEVETALKRDREQQAVQKLLDKALSAEEVHLYPERMQ